MFAVIVITSAYLYFASTLPELNNLTAYQPPLVSRVFNTNGELLAEYADEHRILTPLTDMPDRLKHAFLAAEDEHFYQHPGINPPRILAAAIANLRAGRTVQGGSTITQQVAKNLLLTSERTYSRKIREVILAYRIEQSLSKDDILFLYLNHMYLGRGAYGVASAAWRYFHKRLDELTLAECAMLAGLPKAPGRYAPHLNPELALSRRNTVLHMMEQTGLAEDAEIEAALQEPLEIVPLSEPKLTNAYANAVYQQLSDAFGAETLRRQGMTIIIPYDAAMEKAAIKAVRKGVLEIEQRQFYRGPAAHHEVESWPEVLAAWAETRSEEPPEPDDIFPALVEQVQPDGSLLANDGKRVWQLAKPRWQWKKPEKDMPPIRRNWVIGDEILLQGTSDGSVRLTQQPSIEAALYAIDLEKGTVLARVGGFDFRFGDFDRVSRAKRQPGSAFKPFLYATAMDDGFTPASIVVDSPLVFDNRKTDEFWRPENYKGKFAGNVTLRNALEHSRNLASIKLLQDIGIGRFLRALESYQFKEDFPSQLGLALGSTEVTLKELAESYAVLADSGRRWRPTLIQQVQDRTGKSLLRGVSGHRCQVCHADPVLAVGNSMRPFEQTVDPVSSFLATNIMRGVVERGTGRRALALRRPVAGKTGTTNDQVDAWFTGYSPQILTGVWVGRDSPVSMGRRETGSRAALPIWVEFMQDFHKGKPKRDFSPPAGIEWVVIDRETGKHPTADTKKPFLEAFRAGTAPADNGGQMTGPEQKQSKDQFFELGL